MNKPCEHIVCKRRNGNTKCVWKKRRQDVEVRTTGRDTVDQNNIIINESEVWKQLEKDRKITIEDDDYLLMNREKQKDINCGVKKENSYYVKKIIKSMKGGEQNQQKSLFVYNKNQDFDFVRFQDSQMNFLQFAVLRYKQKMKKKLYSFVNSIVRKRQDQQKGTKQNVYQQSGQRDANFIQQNYNQIQGQGIEQVINIKKIQNDFNKQIGQNDDVGQKLYQSKLIDIGSDQKEGVINQTYTASKIVSQDYNQHGEENNQTYIPSKIINQGFDNIRNKQDYILNNQQTDNYNQQTNIKNIQTHGKDLNNNNSNKNISQLTITKTNKIQFEGNVNIDDSEFKNQVIDNNQIINSIQQRGSSFNDLNEENNINYQQQTITTITNNKQDHNDNYIQNNEQLMQKNNKQLMQKNNKQQIKNKGTNDIIIQSITSTTNNTKRDNEFDYKNINDRNINSQKIIKTVTHNIQQRGSGYINNKQDIDNNFSQKRNNIIQNIQNQQINQQQNNQKMYNQQYFDEKQIQSPIQQQNIKQKFSKQIQSPIQLKNITQNYSKQMIQQNIQSNPNEQNQQIQFQQLIDQGNDLQQLQDQLGNQQISNQQQSINSQNHIQIKEQQNKYQNDNQFVRSNEQYDNQIIRNNIDNNNIDNNNNKLNTVIQNEFNNNTSINNSNLQYQQNLNIKNQKSKTPSKEFKNYSYQQQNYFDNSQDQDIQALIENNELKRQTNLNQKNIELKRQIEEVEEELKRNKQKRKLEQDNYIQQLEQDNYIQQIEQNSKPDNYFETTPGNSPLISKNIYEQYKNHQRQKNDSVCQRKKLLERRRSSRQEMKEVLINHIKTNKSEIINTQNVIITNITTKSNIVENKVKRDSFIDKIKIQFEQNKRNSDAHLIDFDVKELVEDEIEDLFQPKVMNDVFEENNRNVIDLEFSKVLQNEVDLDNDDDFDFYGEDEGVKDGISGQRNIDINFKSVPKINLNQQQNERTTIDRLDMYMNKLKKVQKEDLSYNKYLEVNKQNDIDYDDISERYFKGVVGKQINEYKQQLNRENKFYNNKVKILNILKEGQKEYKTSQFPNQKNSQNLQIDIVSTFLVNKNNQTKDILASKLLQDNEKIFIDTKQNVNNPFVSEIVQLDQNKGIHEILQNTENINYKVKMHQIPLQQEQVRNKAFTLQKIDNLYEDEFKDCQMEGDTKYYFMDQNESDKINIIEEEIENEKQQVVTRMRIDSEQYNKTVYCQNIQKAMTIRKASQGTLLQRIRRESQNILSKQQKVLPFILELRKENDELEINDRRARQSISQMYQRIKSQTQVHVKSETILLDKDLQRNFKKKKNPIKQIVNLKRGSFKKKKKVQFDKIEKNDEYLLADDPQMNSVSSDQFFNQNNFCKQNTEILIKQAINQKNPKKMNKFKSNDSSSARKSFSIQQYLGQRKQSDEMQQIETLSLENSSRLFEQCLLENKVERNRKSIKRKKRKQSKMNGKKRPSLSLNSFLQKDVTVNLRKQTYLIQKDNLENNMVWRERQRVQLIPLEEDEDQGVFQITRNNTLVKGYRNIQQSVYLQKTKLIPIDEEQEDHSNFLMTKKNTLSGQKVLDSSDLTIKNNSYNTSSERKLQQKPIVKKFSDNQIKQQNFQKKQSIDSSYYFNQGSNTNINNNQQGGNMFQYSNDSGQNQKNQRNNMDFNNQQGNNNNVNVQQQVGESMNFNKQQGDNYDINQNNSQSEVEQIDLNNKSCFKDSFGNNNIENSNVSGKQYLIQQEYFNNNKEIEVNNANQNSISDQMSKFMKQNSNKIIPNQGSSRIISQQSTFQLSSKDGGSEMFIQNQKSINQSKDLYSNSSNQYQKSLKSKKKYKNRSPQQIEGDINEQYITNNKSIKQDNMQIQMNQSNSNNNNLQSQSQYQKSLKSKKKYKNRSPQRLIKKIDDNNNNFNNSQFQQQQLDQKIEFSSQNNIMVQNSKQNNIDNSTTSYQKSLNKKKKYQNKSPKKVNMVKDIQQQYLQQQIITQISKQGKPIQQIKNNQFNKVKRNSIAFQPIKHIQVINTQSKLMVSDVKVDSLYNQGQESKQQQDWSYIQNNKLDQKEKQLHSSLVIDKNQQDKNNQKYDKEWEEYQLQYSEKIMKKMNRSMRISDASQNSLSLRKMMDRRITQKFMVFCLKMQKTDLQRIVFLQRFFRKRIHKLILQKIIDGNRQYERQKTVIGKKNNN